MKQIKLEELTQEELYELEKIADSYLKDFQQKFFKDFSSGAYNTFIEAPLSLVDFLDRVSGFKDYRYTSGSVFELDSNLEQQQALNELKIIKEGLQTVFNTEGAWKQVIKILAEDMLERPGYYTGGIITGFGLGKMLLENFTQRAVLATTLNTGKVEEKVQQLYEKGEQYIAQNENINQPKIQLSEQEIKDEVYKKVREYVHENGITSFQDIGQFMEKVREELKNGTIKIENQQQDKEQNLKEIQEEPKEENYNFQVYRR